jgi:glycosyltransferase involved in cell wall biosynthesis
VRVGFVTARYPPDVGGVEKHVERLARHVVERGHEAEVLTQAADLDRTATDELDGVTVRRFPVLVRSADYAFSPSLVRFLHANSRRFDVVHAHNYHALPAAAAAWTHPRSFVFTPHYHGTSASSVRRLLHIPYRRIGGSIFRRADRVICVSGREARLVHRDFPWLGERIEVIHNGVDLDQIRAAVPQEEQRRVILSAGRLEPYKGVERTIEAMRHLNDEYVLRITGEGSAREALGECVARHGLAERVEFLGRVDLGTLYRWFRTTSVYVTMSRIEAMPLTPLEVLAAGASVVASDIPAHREIADATDAKIELVSPEASSTDLAAAIVRAAQTTPNLPTVLDWAEVGERTLAVYAAVSTAKRTPQA